MLLAQQDPQFSQYMFNPLMINPAYAGSRENLSFALFVRDQWTGFPGAPKTQTLSVHSPLKNKKMGLGLNIVGDQIGPKKSTAILGTYAYRIKLGKGKLSFGLRGGLVKYDINWAEVDFKDQTDNYAMNGVDSKTLPTFDFGMYYYGKSFYAGLSVNHLNEPVYGIKSDSSGSDQAMLRKHSFLTVGKAFILSENVVFKPSFLIKTVEGAPGSLDVNASFLINKTLWLGASLRSGSGIAFIFEYNITDKFRAGYAYDLTMNKLKYHSQGSHEIFIGYDFNIFQTKTLSPRYF